MKDIRNFLENFFVAEANTINLKKKPDLKAYNDSVQNMYSFMVKAYFGGFGHVIMNELRDDSFYEERKNVVNINPRHIFKISKYSHNKYGDVWVAYTTTSNADPDFLTLTDAFMVTHEDGKLVIAQQYVYSNYDSDGEYYQWEVGRDGYYDLLFEDLIGPSNIERYGEPLDYLDGIENYNKNA